MKYVFWFFIVPMSLFWGWFGLSYHDINFGTLFLSRAMHDMVFGIYANILGVSYETIVRGFIKACIFDSFLIGGILAYRRRKKIKAWWENRKAAKKLKSQSKRLISRYFLPLNKGGLKPPAK